MAAPSRAAHLTTVLRTALCDGVRVALFMRPHNAAAPGSWAAFVAVIVATLAVQLLVQAAAAGFMGQPAPAGIAGVLLPVSLVALAVGAVGALLRRGTQVLPLVTATLSAALWMDLALTLSAYALDWLPHGTWRAWLATGLRHLPPYWLALAAAVALMRGMALDGRGKLLALLGSLALVAWPLSAVDADHALWQPPYDTAAAAEREAMRAVVSEEILYVQPRLLESELAALQPRREGVPNLYLVSVAGYAAQDVFMREVDSVDTLFRERFGTVGHTLSLVNNPKTLRNRPLATRTALQQALQRVGALMDRDHDVLFLFLTSHGSRDRFLLSFWPLAFYDLTPEHLRILLDQSGVRNRVIVVSACYSGGFVDALKDAHTLVITAAAAERTSFGCSNEADFTYFGKAYFDEALRKTRSFTDAFALALPAIAARERAQGFEPSQPQLDEGSEIAVPLAALRRALDDAAR